jgi:hypothetical protein
MKKAESDLEDELRAEYDLDILPVRRFGPGRTGFNDLVKLEPDVAREFPDAESVNQALRLLIRVNRQNQSLSNDDA